MSIRAIEKAAMSLLLFIATGLIGTGFWWATDWVGLTYVREYLVNALQIDEESPALAPPRKKAEKFADFQSIPSGLFSYGGSTTWASIRENVDPIMRLSHPQFQLRYTQPINDAPGTDNGIRMLLEDQLAFSQSARPLSEAEYQQARQEGFALKQIPVAIDGIAIAVHLDLKIPGLTIEQLKGIYTGNINNWRQVGGPDFPITPYSRPKDAEFFVENVLNGEELSPTVQHIFDTTDALKELISNRGGIYYATAAQIVPQCEIRALPIGYSSNTLIPPYQEPFVEPAKCPEQRNRLNREAIRSGEYPITRRLFVVVKQNGQQDETAGMAYAALLLSEQGQQLISNSGFISLR